MSTTVVQSEAIEKGGLTIPLFHCVFNNDGTVTHFLHEYDLRTYQSLSNLYVICLTQNIKERKNVVGAFYIKTTYHHTDKDFISVLMNNLSVMKELEPLFNKDSTFLPTRLGLSDELPITDDEMLGQAIKQHIKFDQSGTVQ